MKKALRKVLALAGVALALPVLGLTFFAVTSWPAGYPNASRASRSKEVALGAYHVHSVASDGSGTVAEIAEAAFNTGLQFVILTDHNPATLQRPYWSSNGVLIIEAAELSTPFGHVVALDPERLPTADELKDDPVGAIQAVHGYAALAHPIQERNGWTGDWGKAEQATFFELYSGDTMWRRALAQPISVLLPGVGAYLTNPRHALTLVTDEHPEATQKLLELSRKSRMVALCGLDAHGLPTYEEMFGQLAVSIPLDGAKALPPNPDEAGRLIIRRMVEGRSYCAFRALGDGAGFAVEAEDPSKGLRVGQALKVSLPADTSPLAVMVRCHGGCEVQKDGRRVLLQQSGPVHLEVWRRAPGRFYGAEWRPWLVPSPVLVDD